MPEILSTRRDRDALAIRLRVPAALEHFRDHFPGLPILPGVVQLDWVVRLARAHFAGLHESYGVDAFKCHAPVLPDTELSLEVDYDAASGALRFQYSDATRPVCSGALLFRRGP